MRSRIRCFRLAAWLACTRACAIDFEDMMSLTHIFTAAALTLPTAAIAQQALPHAADPNAATPAPAYVSAFSDYRAAADTSAAPDTVWRQANEQLIKQTGHAGHAGMDMRGMEHEAAAPKSSASPPASEAGHGSHHH